MENGKKHITLPISVVIPAYNEELILPALLKSIQQQEIQPLEVIVADANSTDKTKEVALKYGCKVVKGGKIAFGRNAGAKTAQGEYLLFMDADTQLISPYQLAESLFIAVKEHIDIASTKYGVAEDEKNSFGGKAGTILWGLANFGRRLQSLISYPYWEGGAFILVRRTVFEETGGFSEKLSVGEDRDFFQKAVKLGYKYKVLPLKVTTSSRRYSDPKKLTSAMFFLAVEVALVATGLYAGGKIVSRFWKYYGRLGGGEGKDPNEE